MDNSADETGDPIARNDSPPADGDLQLQLAELQRTNRALRLLSSVNQALMHATNEAHLIQQICEIAVEIGGYRLAWVGFAEHNTARTIRPICHAGIEDGYLRQHRFSWADDVQCEPTGMAIRSGTPRIAPDIAEMDACAPWHAAARARGFRAIIALPLHGDGEVIGAFTLYGDAPAVFSAEEVRLLTEMAGDLSFGIATLRTRERQRRAEEALRVSEERFAKAFDTNPDSININRLEDGVYIDINQGFTKMTGYARDEVIGQSSLAGGVDIWVHPEDRQRLVDALRTRGELLGLEAEFRRKNGRILIGLMSAKRVELHGESCVLSITRDITESKEATHLREQIAEALRKSESLLRETQQLAKIGGWEYLIASKTMSWTSEVYSIHEVATDFDPNDIGQNIRFYAAGDQQTIEHAFFAAVTAGTPYDLELQFTSARGTKKWVRTTARAECVDGTVVRVYGNIIDTTDRKQAEEALRASERRFRSLFETMTEGVALHELVRDDNGIPINYRLVDVNPAFALHTGITQEHAKGHLATEVYHTETPPYFDKFLPVAITGNPVVFETYFPPMRKYFTISVCSPSPEGFATIFEDVTTRKQTEQALREEKLFTDAIFDSVPGLLYVYNSDGYLIRWNKKKAEITGYSAAELAGMQILDWFHGEPEDIAVISTAAETALREGYAEAEAHLITKQGAVILFFFTAVRMMVHDQRYLVGIGIDISERRRVEDALRVSEERYRVLVEQAPEAITVYDNDLHRFVDANVNAEHLFGCSRAELLARSPEHFYLPRQPDNLPVTESMRTHVAAALAGEVAVFERLMRSDDGREIICEVRLVRLPSADRQLIRCSFIDITERKRTEDALRLTQFAVDRAGDMIFWFDFAGNILYVNDAVSQRLGYAREALCHMTLFDVDTTFPRTAWPQHAERLRNERSFILERTHQTTSGEVFPVEVSINYLEYNGKEYNFAFVRDISARKHAEAERERLFEDNLAQRLLFETTVRDVPAGIALLQGAEHRYLLANPAYLPFVRGKGEIIGRTVADVFAEIADTVVPLLDQVYRSGEPFSAIDMPLTLLRDGKPDHANISFTYTPWRDAHGHIQGVLALAVETTAQVRARQEVEQERALLRTVLSALPVGIIILDVNGRFVNVNEAAQRIWGGAMPMVQHIAEYVQFRGWWADSGEAVAPEAWAAARAIATGEMSIGEVIDIQRFDDSFGTILNSAVPLRDSDGRISGAVVVIQDISELKQAEEAMKRERTFLASAIDLLPFPIFIISPDFEMIRQNRASFTLQQAPDTLPLGGVEFLDPQTHAPYPVLQWPISHALHGEATPTTECILRQPDGREISILLQTAPIFINDALVAAVVAIQDISALKEADRAKNQFLMVLSHEVKTPLTSIIGWAQLAQGASDMVPEALETILRSAHAQKILLERLLILSRILTGKLLLARQPTDVGELTRQAVRLFQQVAEDRQIDLALEAPHDALRLEADGKLLEQAICEVIDNAINFTPPGGTISVHGRREDTDIVLVVHDSGQGIAPDHLSALLTPFTQLQRKEEIGGLGIGLAVARGIIEAHRGRMTISSDGPGLGTTVTCWLPNSREQVNSSS